MATLAHIAGVYTFLLFGLDAPATTRCSTSASSAVVWIVVMTWICYVGIELSARTQYFLLGDGDRRPWRLFAIVALVKVYAGDGLPDSMRSRRCQWLNPFGID